MNQPPAPTGQTPATTPANGKPLAKPLLLDLAGLGVDLSARVLDREGIARINPHRHEMALLDAIVWHEPSYKLGVAVWNVGHYEFWCRGHFPGKPLLPGVLQIEAGAQLGSFLFNVRHPQPRIAAFTHIDECSFRTPVTPGSTFYLLCEETKFAPRRFTSRIQGMVDGKITFDATITGMVIG